MLHEPASDSGPDPAAAYKMRIGMWMFVCYSIFYAGFVVVNLVSPTLMEASIVFGLNLATVYGFALIVVALVLALIYNNACNVQEHLVATSPPEGEND